VIELPICDLRFAIVDYGIPLAVSFLALALAFIALLFAIVNRRRIAHEIEQQLGDPTTYTVVTDGKFYRVRGPFDTFYTMKMRDLEEARQYRDQLAHWHRSVFEEIGWRAVPDEDRRAA
jgi:hypothetical protein